MYDALTEEEVQRASGFCFEADRQRFFVARALLRHALGACTNTAAGELRFSVSETGKPSLRHPRSEVVFNVSHSGDLVVIALSAGRSIGVDVELIREGPDFTGLAETCFTQSEREIVFADPRNTLSQFYLHWACKEAWIKADGRGMGLALQECAIVEDGRPHCYAVEAGDGRLPWRVRTFATLPGYACAVAADGGPWTLRILHIGDASGRS